MNIKKIKMLHKRESFVVLFTWLIFMLFIGSNCPNNSYNKKKKSSPAVPNNSTSRQVVNNRSSIGGASGGSGSSSGGNSGSSSGRISSSGSSSSGGSSSGVGGGGSGSSNSGSSSGIENIYRNNTLKSRILKILEESGFDKNKKEAIKNYIDSITDELLLGIKDNLKQAKKSNNDGDVTDSEVLHAIWELVSKDTDAVVHQSTGSSGAIDDSSGSVTSHGSVGEAGGFFGISIQSTDKQNVCYMETSLEIVSILPNFIIGDGHLKKLMEKIHNGSCKKDNYGRFCIDWDELPSKWKEQGEYQESLSVFLPNYVNPLLENVNYLCKDDGNAYVDTDLGDLYQQLANLNHQVVFCNTELSSSVGVQSCKDNFNLVAYVVRSGEEGAPGHFYACVKDKENWYKSRCNGSSAVRKIGSIQAFKEQGESPSKVVLLVYVNINH